MGNLAAVGFGSALGALARFGLSLALAHDGFPWATLAANVVGAALIGAAAEAMKPPGPIDLGSRGRLFVMTGFCGGFTTFSLFGLETLELWQRGAPLLAMSYVALSAALWIVAVVVAMRVTRRYVGRWLARRGEAPG
ncbi:MAG: CrcB family protein [Pseudomonadota bacterium]